MGCSSGRFSGGIVGDVMGVFIARFRCRLYSRMMGDHCETRRVVKSNLKGCKVIQLMKSVVFWDHGIYHF